MIKNSHKRVGTLEERNVLDFGHFKKELLLEYYFFKIECFYSVKLFMYKCGDILVLRLHTESCEFLKYIVFLLSIFFFLKILFFFVCLR